MASARSHSESNCVTSSRPGILRGPINGIPSMQRHGLLCSERQKVHAHEKPLGLRMCVMQMKI